MGRTLPTVTHDDVNAAFEDGSYLKENDDRLVGLPGRPVLYRYPERHRPPSSE